MLALANSTFRSLLLRATPRKGTVREAGLASQQMIEIGAQAESAKDESAQGDSNQSLEDPGKARPSGEQREPGGAEDRPGHPLGKAAWRWRRRERGEVPGACDDSIVERVKRISRGNQRVPPQNASQ